MEFGRAVTTAQWEERVETARRALFQHPHYDLGYTQTMRLHALLGPRLAVDRYQTPEEWKWQDQDPLALLGWQRHAWNSILCAEHIVDFCLPLNLPVDFRDILKQAKQAVLQKSIGEFQQTQFDLDYDEIAYEYLEWRKHQKVYIKP